MQHGPVLGAVDVLASEHRVDLAAQVARVGERGEPCDGLVRDAVLRVVEVPARDFDVHAIAASRIGGEQLVQMLRADGRRVRLERAPLGQFDE